MERVLIGSLPSPLAMLALVHPLGGALFFHSMTSLMQQTASTSQNILQRKQLQLQLQFMCWKMLQSFQNCLSAFTLRIMIRIRSKTVSRDDTEFLIRTHVL